MKLRGALVGCLARLVDFSTSCAPVLPEACKVPAEAISDCCSSSAALNTGRAFAVAAACARCCRESNKSQATVPPSSGSLPYLACVESDCMSWSSSAQDKLVATAPCQVADFSRFPSSNVDAQQRICCDGQTQGQTLKMLSRALSDHAMLSIKEVILS